MFRTHGAYELCRRVQRGDSLDNRTRIAKAVTAFRDWLHEPFGEHWNSLQEAREQIAVPIIVFYFACCGVKDGTTSELLADFKWAHNALERLIKDIHSLASSKTPSRIPSLKDIIDR